MVLLDISAEGYQAPSVFCPLVHFIRLFPPLPQVKQTNIFEIIFPGSLPILGARLQFQQAHGCTLICLTYLKPKNHAALSSPTPPTRSTDGGTCRQIKACTSS